MRKMDMKLLREDYSRHCFKNHLSCQIAFSCQLHGRASSNKIT